MNILMCLIVLLGFIYHIYSTEPCKKICILDNLDCVTRGGFDVYKTVVNGAKGLVAPLDPLYIEKIEGVYENVKYILTKITMTGLKNCTITKLKLNVTQLTYDQYQHCPKLVSHFHFEAQENKKISGLGGYGIVTVTVYNYTILNYGLYSVFVKEDHRPHFFLITQNSKSNLNGKLEIATTNSHLTDTPQVNEPIECMDDRLSQIETFLHKPIVTRAMTILMNETDVYLRHNTMGTVLPYLPSGCNCTH